MTKCINRRFVGDQLLKNQKFNNSITMKQWIQDSSELLKRRWNSFIHSTCGQPLQKKDRRPDWDSQSWHVASDTKPAREQKRRMASWNANGSKSFKRDRLMPMAHIFVISVSEVWSWKQVKLPEAVQKQGSQENCNCSQKLVPMNALQKANHQTEIFS